MATEPTKEPEWASVLQKDPPSTGEYNIIEPTESKKDTGFFYQERPPRQDHNWLFNLIWKWIQWFKQERDTHETEISSILADFAQVNITSVEVSGAGSFTVGSPATIDYVKIGNKLWASINLNGTVVSNITNWLKINLSPIPDIDGSTVWDTNIAVYGFGTDSGGTQRFSANQVTGGKIQLLPKDAGTYPVGAVNAAFMFFVGFTNP